MNPPFNFKGLLPSPFIVAMSSAFINFKNSKPCIFTIGGVSKFGIRTEQEFLRISRVVSGSGQFQTVCVPVDNPENEKEIPLKTTGSELQEMGLYGDSLKLAQAFLGEYIAEANRVEIAESGGISALINVLRIHANHIGVQTQACRAICAIAHNEDNKKAFIEEGTIPLLIRAIGMGGDVEIAAAEALMVLNDQSDIPQMQQAVEIGNDIENIPSEELVNGDEMLEQELPE